MTLSNSDTQQECLDADKVVAILAPDGPLSRVLKGFEPRRQQQLMARNVVDAYNRNEIALIEAGTGTGKSLAYLIPALLWAAHTKERTLISTNTITLQEQLLNKDIPFVTKALGLDIKAVLVKGMHNYVCLRKMQDTSQEQLLLPANELEEFRKIEGWAATSHDGSRSSLSFAPSSGFWDKVAAESDACSRNDCPFFQQCHFFKARRQASDAQILIVNHHLLFADLVYRAENDNYKDPGILPAYSRIIIDEAHNIEDIATEYFADHVSQMGFLRLLARLTSEKGGKVHGILPRVKEKLIQSYRNELPKEANSIYSRLNVDLPAQRRELLQKMHEVFEALSNFSQALQPAHASAAKEMKGQADSKLRLLQHHLTHPAWKNDIVPRTKLLLEALRRYSQSLKSLDSDFKSLNHPRLEEQIKGILYDLSALTMRLDSAGIVVETFMEERIPPSKVRWIETQALRAMVNVSFMDAKLDISKILVDFIFERFSTIVLCSATLTTNHQFDFIRKRLGLIPDLIRDRKVSENIYDSPFDFPKQALLAVVTDLPNPTETAFIHEAAEKIWQLIQASRGNAFVLFTSYTMLTTCFQMLESRLKTSLYHALKQGDGDRRVLLNAFKSKDRSVLFGTDSFWEGVDVEGEALRSVIIVKLPFKVPNEPIIQARSEAIAANGGDPFYEYSLPQAIVKFKQGFGRLIRNKCDRGCIVCLDHRIFTKKYGKLFLDSLPACQKIFASSDEVVKGMTEFYKKTHYLTFKN